MPISEPDFAPTGQKLPVLFFGHGNPMNAIEDSVYSQAWVDAGQSIPRPQAILCVSAHWETAGTKTTAMEKPRTIHDFGGFPPELYAQQYPAPGSPALARLVQQTVSEASTGARVDTDTTWGLDHGAWSVLIRVYPQAGIPVVQLSLDRTQPPAYHYALGQALKPLRRRGVLIVGSGNIVHNLMVVRPGGAAYDWAQEFDQTMERLMLAGDHPSIVNYDRLGQTARLAIPTNEHFLPLLYVLGLQDEGEPLSFFAEGLEWGSLSMRSVKIG
jgi:4,5-DOPA dioxygenase extradiol